MLYLETEFLREPYVSVLPDVLGKDLEEEMECTLIKFVAEKLVNQSTYLREGLPFRGSWTGRRNGLTGIS